MTTLNSFRVGNRLYVHKLITANDSTQFIDDENHNLLMSINSDARVFEGDLNGKQLCHFILNSDHLWECVMDGWDENVNMLLGETINDKIKLPVCNDLIVIEKRLFVEFIKAGIINNN